MPLLTSPIDGSPMRQIQRFGIELDVCPTSGGVWLDRGELEKLMALMRTAAEEESQYQQQYSPQPAQHYEQPRYSQPPLQRPQQHGYDKDYHYKGKHKKKGALHQMMDIFDF
ncbi:MAG: hypothetical protein FJX23_05285 [Alphaproteobacteria bacterium]|nr:hypothetical protein [Alphaproteobacteria bacterium]